MSLSSAQIRQQFIDFFVQRHAHAFVPSSPVVPLDDPTLLFTNAGMNQFKPIFLGSEPPRHTRVANTQKCIRAGGKHNDLEDVGHDTYHHTFFEMLGNWSFGDYFKRDAIKWAWELLTHQWGVDKSRLHATVFQGSPEEGVPADDEAVGLWKSQTDINPAHIHRFGKKDNFWEMGDTGPCGPCSEIHIDLTPDKSGIALVNKGDARVMEIWNLVFIQFNRGPDGKLTPLPAQHVDTGMGFERVTSVLQGVGSNYDTDVFSPIFSAIREVTGAPEYGRRLESPGHRDPAVMVDVAYRVIADHLRCLTFALTDGAQPSNDGRGYVLRRILRRAVRYGRQFLNTHKPFMCDLVPSVVSAMSAAFPELTTAHGGRNAKLVADMLRGEEESFGRTLDRGITLFGKVADRARGESAGRISGTDAFTLHDTYGFPIDLTQLMAAEQGLSVDVAKYDELMAAQGGGESNRSDAALAELTSARHASMPRTIFVGYERQDESDLQVVAILRGDDLRKSAETVDTLRAGERGALLLNRTPFYAEKGGQVGDCGLIGGPGGARFQVETTEDRGGLHLHIGVCETGSFSAAAGASHTATVDQSVRHSTMRNHTATHVMNWALREVLGEGVEQKGSLVDPDKTRFDFSHHAALTGDEIQRIESLVHDQVKSNLQVHAGEAALADARRIAGLRAVFGEKYPERVRVVSIGPPLTDLLANPADARWRGYSIEFCGGTHLTTTGDIGRFRLIDEGGAGTGIRRMTAITGQRAESAERASAALSDSLRGAAQWDDSAFVQSAQQLASAIDAAEIPLLDRQRLRQQLAPVQDRAKSLQKQQARHDAADVLGRAEALLGNAPRVGQTAVIAGNLGAASVEQLRAASDSLRAKAGSAAVLLAAETDGKVTLLAAMTPDVVQRGIKAGDIIKEVSPVVGGKGGGRPDLAQGGGPDLAQLTKAVEMALNLMTQRLGR